MRWRVKPNHHKVSVQAGRSRYDRDCILGLPFAMNKDDKAILVVRMSRVTQLHRFARPREFMWVRAVQFGELRHEGPFVVVVIDAHVCLLASQDFSPSVSCHCAH